MKIKILLSTTALTLLAAAASAGLKQPAPVIVDFDLMFAQGDQVTARIAKDDVSFIGCGVRVFDDGFAFGFCQASDSEENQIVCLTENPYLLQSIGGISDLAFITFSFVQSGVDMNGDPEYDCTRVGSSTQSFYIPNFTTKGKN